MAQLMIITLAVLCVAVPLWLGARHGLVRLVSPMHLLAYFAAFGFALKVVAYAYVPDWAFYTGFVTTSEAALRGATYLSIFILLMCLGYRCAVQPYDMRSHRRHAQTVAAGLTRQTWLFAVAFAVAGLTLLLMLRARGGVPLTWDVVAQFNTAKQINVNADGVGATLAGLKTLFIVPKLAFVLLLGQGIVLRDLRLLLKAAVLAMLLVVIAILSGDRFELVELMVYAVTTFAVVGGRIGLRGLLAVCAVAAAIVLTSAYMTALRGQDDGLWHQIIGSTYFLDINAAIMVTDRVTPQMHLWGESYGWWVFGWVPRAIWIDKPAIDLGVYFKAVVMGVPTGGAFNVTGPGEAFINFGWAGVAVGFVLGWVYRKLEVATLASAHVLRHGAIWFYPLLVYPFVQATLQSSFSAFVVGAAAQAVLIIAVIACCVPRYRPVFPRAQLSRRVMHGA